MDQACSACLAHQQNPLSGRYCARCAKCGARLLASAKGNRPAQLALLESITRRKDNAPRADILAEMAAMPRT